MLNIFPTSQLLYCHFDAYILHNMHVISQSISTGEYNTLNSCEKLKNFKAAKYKGLTVTMHNT